MRIFGKIYITLQTGPVQRSLVLHLDENNRLSVYPKVISLTNINQNCGNMSIATWINEKPSIISDMIDNDIVDNQNGTNLSLIKDQPKNTEF